MLGRRRARHLFFTKPLPRTETAETRFKFTDKTTKCNDSYSYSAPGGQNSSGEVHCALLLGIIVAVAPQKKASVFVVNNTDDSGPGSLREAITAANANSGLDSIEFNIPGTGVHTITPMTQLPSITSPVVLDGETQPGAKANTLANGDNAVLLIEISGAIVTNNGNAFVLVTGASGSTIRGLVIDNAWSTAVLIQTDTIAVEGCFLGTDPTGLWTRVTPKE